MMFAISVVAFAISVSTLPTAEGATGGLVTFITFRSG